MSGPRQSAGFDLQPLLVGPRLTLRPLRADDLEPLWQVSKDPLIWALHPESHAPSAPASSASSSGRWPRAARSRSSTTRTGSVIGSSRFYDWDPGAREVAIGYTFLARRYWGGEANREMKRLMIEHALQQADCIWFHVATSNLRSRRAMEKIGARLSHTGPRPVNGVLVDFCYYRIDRGNWQG